MTLGMEKRKNERKCNKTTMVIFATNFGDLIRATILPRLIFAFFYLIENVLTAHYVTHFKICLNKFLKYTSFLLSTFVHRKLQHQTPFSHDA